MSFTLREIGAKIKELEQEGAYSSPELPELIFRRAQLYYAGAKVYDNPSNTEKIKGALEAVNTLTEFDEELFITIIKQMTIYKETKIEVEFINGIVIERPLETQGKDGKDGSSKKDGSNYTTPSKI
jgi:hypothetical protein